MGRVSKTIRPYKEEIRRTNCVKLLMTEEREITLVGEGVLLHCWSRKAGHANFKREVAGAANEGGNSIDRVSEEEYPPPS